MHGVASKEDTLIAAKGGAHALADLVSCPPVAVYIRE